jgi:hypothetical protein
LLIELTNRIRFHPHDEYDMYDYGAAHTKGRSRIEGRWWKHQTSMRARGSLFLAKRIAGYWTDYPMYIAALSDVWRLIFVEKLLDTNAARKNCVTGSDDPNPNKVWTFSYCCGVVQAVMSA